MSTAAAAASVTTAPPPVRAPPLLALSWAPEELGDALVLLASAVGGTRTTATSATTTPVPPRGASPAALERWMDAAAAWLGVEAEGVDVTGVELLAFARTAGPAILRVGTFEAPRYLVVRDAGRRGVRLACPDLRDVRVPAEAVVDAILAAVDPRVHEGVERVLVAASLDGPGRDAARAALLRQRLAGKPVRGGWLVRLAPSAPFGRQLATLGVPARVAWLATGHAAAWLLGLAGWAMVGRGALAGRLDGGWLLAWALLVLSLVPLSAALVRAEGRLALDVGGLLKQRLLVGALRLRPEEVRHQGMGQLLGRVIESEAIEAAAASGGLMAAFAVLELVLALFVLAGGVGGLLHAGLLLAWLVGTGLVAAAFYRRRSAWSASRLGMTNTLVEGIVGHRTRLAQEDPARWHHDEDAVLARYVGASGAMDRAAVWLTALVPGGWMLVGLLGLGPALVWGRADAAPLAVAVGGVLLAHGSLRQLVAGVASLTSAGIAWGQVGTLFEAAARPVTVAPPGVAAVVTDNRTPAATGPLLEAHGLVFRHDGRAETVLDGVHLTIHPGDRLLLEGPSGGGKSTLGALLAGLREPVSGLLLLGGLDRRTLGADGWRRRVVTAPQFHENHVLGHPLAFNLLMGRAWPPDDDDLDEAQALCEELGLGPLLARMPSGMLQMVGETGWQLSHGEKSRLYIARALLQGADLVVLDESFAALDPENLQRALACVFARAKAVLVIAHP